MILTNTHKKSYQVLLLFVCFFQTIIEAKITPKMRGKAGKTLKEKKLDSQKNYEYVHFNKWIIAGCTITCLSMGLLLGYLSYFSHDPSIEIADKIIFGITSPISIAGSMLLIKYLTTNKPFLIIGEKGIQSFDHGFIAWEQINCFKITIHGSIMQIHLLLTNKKNVFITDGFLKDSCITIIEKIIRYKKITYHKTTDSFFLEPLEQSAL